MRALTVELSKLISLPSVWLAFAAGLIVPNVIAVIATLNGSNAANIDTGFGELSIGVLGAIVIGGIAIGSEYVTEGEDSAGGRQITTSLIAIPSRTQLLLAKVGATAISTVVLAIFAIVSVFTTIYLISGSEILTFNGEMLARMVGVVVYWVLMALFTFGLTVLTRNAIIPIGVMVINSSAVTVTFLLTRMTPLATYLPDMAGQKMFIHGSDTGMELAPIAGGVIMGAWVVVLLIIAGFTFLRRDVG
ncbi:ABC transporter permease [Virgibacillus sp. NKC19-3]|uniref:ABC transporter permease n=1 Tax=Virgibacillus saliphilus TaxID=2831674 RepID=UPI001C9BB75D|nr:ABC transporter permease [Virgibacillus sp. NKC19-3]MBY7141906.1 ABC transporter permease [Virgibacillus sp. NKC19-3]